MSGSGGSFFPASALLNASAVVSLFFIVGKLMEQFAWKLSTLAAVFKALVLAAGLHRAGIAPERLVHMYAARAVHLLPVGALGTQQAAS